MSNEEVIWQWLDGCPATNRALRTDGTRLYCCQVLVVETRSQWKTVAIRNSHRRASIQRLIERIKDLCHTIGFSDVGNPGYDKLERTIKCQDL